MKPSAPSTTSRGISPTVWLAFRHTFEHFRPTPTATVSELSLHVTTRYLTDATAAQWAVLQEVQSAVPDARVYLRERVLSWTDDREAPRLRVVTVLGFLKRGPLTLRREFCVPDSCSSMPEPEGGAK